MKKEQVKIGGLYRAKVSDKVVAVRIDAAHSGGGWNATNTATGKRIRVKSAQRLRGAVKGDSKEAEATEPKAEAKKAKGTKAPREKRPKRVSALDAAAQVLAKADNRPSHPKPAEKRARRPSRFGEKSPSFPTGYRSRYRP